MIESFFNVKNFKIHEKVLKFSSGIKYFKTVMVAFFSIKNFKRRNKVMESFFSINNFKKLSFKSFKEP